MGTKSESKSACTKVSPREANNATAWTKKANQSVLEDPALRWFDQNDFENAQKGFIARDSQLLIRDAKGNTVMDMEAYSAFIQPNYPPPDTVNPSLWRIAQLNTIAGIFKVTDRIYQIRGYDLACMVVIESDTGYIIVDTLTTIEESQAALSLLNRNVGDKPIKAVIITHSHADHFGGIAGIVSDSEIKSGAIKIIAPHGFTEASLNENVLAGSAMARRAAYQFGLGLQVGPQGIVDSGLGKSRRGGKVSFLPPTDEIFETGQQLTIDGVEIVFVMSPESEAPAEMEFYLPQFKTLCVAENVNQTIHNLYPMRGALTRDAKAWAGYINEMLEMFPGAEFAVGTHFWPVRGKKEVHNFLRKQRNMYLYLHDQTLRLANLGYTGAEIAQMVQLPPSLASEWFNRPYYGSIKNNVRAIYTRYLGWYDGNPANLNPLPPEATAKRIIEYMGGSAPVLEKARKAFDNGEYRWVAQVLNYVVFADPDNIEARNLEASAFEQLAYQEECGPWRNAYLVGAQELKAGHCNAALPRGFDVYLGMPEKSLFDALSVRLNGLKAVEESIGIDFVFSDSGRRYSVVLEDCVLISREITTAASPELTITADKPSFIRLMFLGDDLDKLVGSGQMKWEGDKDKIYLLLSLLDVFDGHFNIVLP